jgi:O-antigen chain-terminating methyltransferase
VNHPDEPRDETAVNVPSDRLSKERDDAHRRYHEAFAALDRIVNESAAAAGTDDAAARVAAFQSLLVQFLQQLTPYVDTKLRVVEQAAADAAMAATSAQRTAAAAARAAERVPAHAGVAPPGVGDPGRQAGARSTGPSADEAVYVGFEDCFRGSEEEIRRRQADYLPLFEGASDVLDVGCGRGEFLLLLREAGIRARGVDANEEMVEVCRKRGLTAECGDAVAYLERLADESLGGLFTAQVVEHLPPARLTALLRHAARALRPGARLVLETINPACWVAFFESYIRDLTHVAPLHPETLKFLVIASGFTDVQVQFRTPVADDARLQQLKAAATDDARLAELIEAFNANMERLNERMFTYLDYAIVAVRA